MSVVIKIEMPNDCTECRIAYQHICPITLRMIDGDKRPEWCPLMEVNIEEE